MEKASEIMMFIVLNISFTWISCSVSEQQELLKSLFQIKREHFLLLYMLAQNFLWGK